MFGILQFILKAPHTLTLLQSAFLHSAFSDEFPGSLPSSVQEPPRQIIGMSVSRKIITFPNLSLYNPRGFRLQFSKAVKNSELRIHLMRFQINKAFQAGKKQKENLGNATAIKSGSFEMVRCRACELETSLFFKILAIYMLNYFR